MSSKISLLAVVLACALAGCLRYETIALCLRDRGEPVAVATSYRVDKGDLRTIHLYGLDLANGGLLAAERERILVYTTDPVFVQHLHDHFQALRESAGRTGSTRYATIAHGTELEIFHFDASGHLMDADRVFIDVARFEVGTENEAGGKQPSR